MKSYLENIAELLVFTCMALFLTGNGPSGICLSYLLSGYTPYLSPDGVHPNPILHNKLTQNPHLSLLDQVMHTLNPLTHIYHTSLHDK